MALDRSPELFSPQMNSTSLFLWFQLVTPGMGPVLIPRDIIWIKLTKVYKEMLHTKKVSSIPSSFREEEFWSWSSLFLCSNLWPPGWAQFWPQRNHMNNLIKVHKEMLKTKYQSPTSSSFRGEELWRLDSLFLCSNMWPPGWGQSWPQEHHMNKFGRGPLECYISNNKAIVLSVWDKKIFKNFILYLYVKSENPHHGTNFHSRAIIWSTLLEGH